MQLHNILWWNLENLFEIQGFKDRPDWLQKELAGELKGWTESVLNKKIAQLASVITQINPDIIACCELENASVLERLILALKPLNRAYKVLHHDSKDQRSIDVAFIYDSKKYNSDGLVFSLELQKRLATRELVQVNLTTIEGNNPLILIGAHFPARIPSKYDTEPFRIMAAETLSYWVMRTIEIKSKETGLKDIPIIVMGDFNDEPHDRSMTEYALATNNLRQIENARTADYLYNPMWELRGNDEGTFVFGSDKFMFDQVLLSKSIAVKKAPFKLKSLHIVNLKGMTKGDYNSPIRFSRPSKSDYNPEGFSDHLPINFILEEI